MKHRRIGRSAKGLRFGIVVAKFNQGVTGKLLQACVYALESHGVVKDAIDVVRVPGAFEIPLVARTMAVSGRVDAVICLGAVIRGDTPHFDYICAVVSRGIGQVTLDTAVPIIFGVLTTETVAQAEERADPKKFNRGGEAAKSAIEMVRVMRMLRGEADKSAISKLTSGTVKRRAWSTR
ncbi:MAG: 6,7-dimethyl-8-ribityllumazine synthase [Candidatus Nitrospira kreftii]|mgnify:CR=1 FL=1|uniref:6,7-dimethyl-8-ribityllumazine synthase n=1 Tax=Candidatus Nitrospira kreftii TaxID=2652173 RepID=A0A7S8IYR9_9BACT|nr:MAG: 6,7-dimethyl-8-ribityllumazine synthase [Candidatus Nitrospira kreftii]